MKAEGRRSTAAEMVEISRDGKRVYFTTRSTRRGTSSSIQTVSRLVVKIDADPKGGMSSTRSSSSSSGLCARTRCAGRRRTPRSDSYCYSDRDVSREVGSTALWLMLLLWPPTTASTPAWGGCSQWALGMQQQKGSAVSRSLRADCDRHAAAIGGVVLAAALVARAPLSVIRYLVARLLIGLASVASCAIATAMGPYRVGFRDLVVWSFLMASAHGAG